MKKSKKIMALILVSIMVLALYGCGKTSMVGTWTGTLAGDTEVSYTFEKDGSGSYNQGGIALSMTYKTEGDQLTMTMTFLGQTQEQTYTYSIKKDTMTLKVSDDETITLTKSK